MIVYNMSELMVISPVFVSCALIKMPAEMDSSRKLGEFTTVGETQIVTKGY